MQEPLPWICGRCLGEGRPADLFLCSCGQTDQRGYGYHRGGLEVFPGATNVVPEKVRLSLEIRAREDWMVDKAYERLMEQCGDVSSFRLLWQEEAHPMDPRCDGCHFRKRPDAGLSHKRMVSGAGHDSMTLSQVTRSGMIFCASVGGLSHCKEEYTRWE